MTLSVRKTLPYLDNGSCIYIHVYIYTYIFIYFFFLILNWKLCGRIKMVLYKRVMDTGLLSELVFHSSTLCEFAKR